MSTTLAPITDAEVEASRLDAAVAVQDECIRLARAALRQLRHERAALVRDRDAAFAALHSARKSVAA